MSVRRFCRRGASIAWWSGRNYLHIQTRLAHFLTRSVYCTNVKKYTANFLYRPPTTSRGEDVGQLTRSADRPQAALCRRGSPDEEEEEAHCALTGQSPLLDTLKHSTDLQRAGVLDFADVHPTGGIIRLRVGDEWDVVERLRPPAYDTDVEPQVWGAKSAYVLPSTGGRSLTQSGGNPATAPTFKRSRSSAPP